MRLTIIFLLLAAGALRIIPAFSTEFWYDEVMSLMLAREAGSIAGVFRIPYDNNHILNGITLLLTGDAPHWGFYRVPAVLFGTLTVLLAWHVARPASVTTDGARGRRAMDDLRERSRSEGLIALLLFGVSYPMVLFSSEARGYAALAFFSLAAFALAKRWLAHPRLLTAILFVACSILGFLSHITFSVTFAGLVVFLIHASASWRVCQRKRFSSIMSYWKIYRTDSPDKHDAHTRTPFPNGANLPAGRPRRNTCDSGRQEQRFKACVSLIGPVIAALFLMSFAPAFPPAIYLGSAQYSFLSSLREAATVPLGFPSTIAGIVLGSAALIIVSLTELRHMRRERNGEWILFSAILLSGSVIFAFGIASGTWGTRYLLVPIVFFLLLLARFIARLLKRQSRAAQCVGALLIAGFVFLNMMGVLQLITVGRGRYLDALRYMAQNADLPTGQAGASTIHGVTITVGSNATSDPVLIRYYGQFLPQGTTMEYIRSDGTPEWYIVSDYLHIFDPGDEPLDVAGATYRLERVYRYHRESGQNWFLYRKKDN